ncbi:unnamed protein product [Triticum aestivum]|uniref:F-box associated domain-containing protein n=2 Tax=Triticum aestivum TaxID=4565 RepID=A0A9R1N658_WHEAT|nr:uncharacterized protein LOC123055163 isoform X1 [Triticum aestivum]KAF7102101.1 hypothetical protein CFC21_103288 [Triticum aestivum]SPT20829.1 unnamed protein product [Triticum aestivum]
MERSCLAQCFLAPPSDDQVEETSFRVIWLLVLQTRPVALVFSSGTGQWQALSRSEPLPAFLLSTWKVWFVSRHYAHGCFYWVSGSGEKLLVLDIQRMEFSMADHPPCVRFRGDDVAIAEAGQGMTVMFVPKPDTDRRIYTVWRRSNGGSSAQWQMETETFSLDSGSLIKGAVGRHLLLYHVGSVSVKPGCYIRDVNTLQLERVCDSYPHPSEVYCNFPPSLLSSPMVSSVPRHADHPGVDDTVPAPEPRADPGGVEGPTGQELTGLAGGPPCKRRRRCGRSGSRTRGGRSRWMGRRRLRLDPWWMRAWGRMRGQIKVLSRTAATKSFGGRGLP